MVGGWSPQLHTWFHVSGTTRDTHARLLLRVRDSHPLWSAVPSRSASIHLTTRVPQPQEPGGSWFALVRFRSPLLTESLCFPFLRILRFFTSPRSLRTPMYSAHGDGTSPRRVSPFRYLRIKGWLPPPRSFSQAPTSFIASQRQGIRHVLLLS